MSAIDAARTDVPIVALCRSLGVSRAAVYRRRQPSPVVQAEGWVRAASPRALAIAERQAVLDTLHSERFLDAAPIEVHATLLEEGTYLCSPRTIERLRVRAPRAVGDGVRHVACRRRCLRRCRLADGRPR